MFRKFFMMTIALATLSGCQTTHQSDLTKTPVVFEALKGFENQDLTAAALSFQHSCQRLIDSPTLSHKVVNQQEWLPICQKFLDLNSLTSGTFKHFLKENFTIEQHSSNNKYNGFLTGYFQPEIEVSKTKTDLYRYPIYRRPADLIVIEDLATFTPRAQGIRIAGTVTQGTLKPYFTRAEITLGALANKGHEIAWAKDHIDLFFMHIQGSGRLVFKEGSPLDVSYDGTNGMAYTAIGRALIERGEIALENMSMGALKDWLRANPDQAQALLNTNASYVFFKECDRCAQGPIGAQNTPLTALGSLAVDPHYIPLGSLIWIETDHDIIAQRLVVAQDVGGAIKGPLRGDFYCGSGPRAGEIAGPLKAQASFYSLIPKV